jgi:hypothetical protein
VKTGTSGSYHWAEFWNEEPPLDLPQVIRALRGRLMGLRGLNTSWDSGLLHPSDPGLPSGWTYEGDHAVSPPVTDVLAEQWPASGEGSDEWYFFREVPRVFNLNAFCNYAISLAEAEIVPFPGGISFWEQVERWRPEFVVGSGYSLFLISRHEGAVKEFSALAREA